MSRDNAVPVRAREHESVEDVMPGAMRKMGVYLGLVEEDDGYGDIDPHDRGRYAVITRPKLVAAEALR